MRASCKEVCARVDIGITSADYALSDTGTLVMIASPAESRLVSLLPPAHLAVVPRERILTGPGRTVHDAAGSGDRRPVRWC